MVFLGHTKPGEPWSVKSRALAEGLLLYEDSVNALGIPLREATDPERDGWYEVKDDRIDYAEAALEEYRRVTKDLEPGVILRVVDAYEGEESRPEAARRPVLEPPRGEAGLGDITPGLPREPTL